MGFRVFYSPSRLSQALQALAAILRGAHDDGHAFGAQCAFAEKQGLRGGKGLGFRVLGFGVYGLGFRVFGCLQRQ